MKRLPFLILSLLITTVSFTQNYDESKVCEFHLPEILISKSGNQVHSQLDWCDIRRVELLQLFENNIYGIVPTDFDSISFDLVHQDDNSLNGKAIYKEIKISTFREQNKFSFSIYLYTPKNVVDKIPVFITINNRGWDTMQVSNENHFWPVLKAIESGYAMVTFDVNELAADDKNKFSNQLISSLYPEQVDTNNGMRALGAWGWGASRIIDYLKTDESIDSKKIIVVGHSRAGKAALWCGAQDQRVAITISNESGNSGAKLSRRNFGESVEFITEMFPHWFIPHYATFANREYDLPVDQHMLLALIAPRAVYVASAADDLWADPKGQYLALCASQPAFNLFNLNLNLPEKMPANNKQLIQLPLGFHNRDGKHDMTLFDWICFIEFANQYFNIDIE